MISRIRPGRSRLCCRLSGILFGRRFFGFQIEVIGGALVATIFRDLFSSRPIRQITRRRLFAKTNRMRCVYKFHLVFWFPLRINSNPFNLPPNYLNRPEGTNTLSRWTIDSRLPSGCSRVVRFQSFRNNCTYLDIPFNPFWQTELFSNNLLPRILLGLHGLLLRMINL